MIQKVMPRINQVKSPIRTTLKDVGTNLKRLYGSSMSNWSGPRFIDTEMIIPGGLSYKEKGYFLLKGKLPPSVHERWFQRTEDYVAKDGDQSVTVEIADRYVGAIIEKPHDVCEATAAVDSIDAIDTSNISEGLTDAIGNGGIDTDLPTDGDEISTFEIWKHLAGFQ